MAHYRLRLMVAIRKAPRHFRGKRGKVHIALVRASKVP